MSVSIFPSSSHNGSFESRTQGNAVVWSLLLCVVLVVAGCKTELARVLSKEPRSKDLSLYAQAFIGKHSHLFDVGDTVSIDHIVMHPFFSLQAVLASEEKMRLMESSSQTDIEILFVEVANRYNAELKRVLHSSFDLQKDAESAILKNRTGYTGLIELVQEYETFKTLINTPLFVLPSVESYQHTASSDPKADTTNLVGRQNARLLAHLLEITCGTTPFLRTESVYSDKGRVSHKDVGAIHLATAEQDTVAVSGGLSSQCIPMMTAGLMGDISGGRTHDDTPVFLLTNGASLSSREVRKYLVGKYTFKEGYPTVTTMRDDGALVTAPFSSYQDLVTSISHEREHLGKANFDAYRRTLKNPDFQKLQHGAYRKTRSRTHIARP